MSRASVIARVRKPCRLVAALLALLLLSYASVRSTVMQAAMAEPLAGVPMCGGDMAASAMSAMAPTSRPERPISKSTRTCPYCAAAAHAPLACGAAPALSSARIHFVAYQLQTLRGPRGPPAVRPRARDPPARILSI